MVRSLHRLAETAIRAKDMKPGRYPDGGGLYLRVSKGSTKSWSFVQFKGTGAAREWVEVGLGVYPAVSLRDARVAAEQCRDRVRRGLAAMPAAPAVVKVPTFDECATSFVDEVGKDWSNPKHRDQWRMTLGAAYCGSILARPVCDVSTDDVVAVLEPVWLAKPETAQRLRGRIERVLDYARVKGHRSGENPARWRGNLEHVLPKRRKLQRGHHSAMPYPDLPAFMVRLRAVQGVSALALEFLILTAARSGEVIGSTWDEMDLQGKVWTVPSVRMKARKVHRVPLPDAAVAILSGLHDVRTSVFVFPGDSRGGKDRPLSVMALTMAMRRLGVGDYTPHGFRSAFRDWVGDETDFAREVAEAALAHRTGDETERAYRRGDALEKRRTLMVAWAAFLGI